MDDALPQKKFYRQRAHSNPMSDHDMEHPISPDDCDWSEHFPSCSCPSESSDVLGNTNSIRRVTMLDVGCGYGGLLIGLATMFPQELCLGIEIRVKVCDYVKDRIVALRKQNPGKYLNISALRTNAMKYLPNYFRKGQLKKMFFLFPDPHFKKPKHKWRIISPTLLAEYAYLLSETEGVLYTVTDVKELSEWMNTHLGNHPLFTKYSAQELEADPVVRLILEMTEEGQKVARNGGQKYVAVFKRTS